MRVLSVLPLLFVAFGYTTCSTGSPTTDSAAVSYTDPFAYCAAVGTIDTPDARYHGPAVPKAITEGLTKATEAATLPPTGSFWRCMDGKVYACTVGANLPCQAKANLSRKPTGAVNEYCRQNPNADFIPMVVTGRETVYEWRCRSGSPEVVKEFVEPDARGYISNIWYEIPATT